MGKNKSATIVTVIVAVFAVVVAFIAITKSIEAKNEEDDLFGDSDVPFIPSEEIQEEMKDAAEALIEGNYAVVKLFYTIGLDSEEEPYGNRPEEGYYNVISDEYKSTADVFALVDNTFTESEAKRLKEDSHGFEAPLYIDKANGRLGIHENFEPDYEYAVDWSEATYVVIPLSNTECTLKITFKLSGVSKIEEVKMLKIGDKWLLDKVLY